MRRQRTATPILANHRHTGAPRPHRHTRPRTRSQPPALPTARQQARARHGGSAFTIFTPLRRHPGPPTTFRQVEASDRLAGDFTAQDEVNLVRLASLTTTALDALARLHLPEYRARSPIPGNDPFDHRSTSSSCPGPLSSRRPVTEDVEAEHRGVPPQRNIKGIASNCHGLARLGNRPCRLRACTCRSGRPGHRRGRDRLRALQGCELRPGDGHAGSGCRRRGRRADHRVGRLHRRRRRRPNRLGGHRRLS